MSDVSNRTIVALLAVALVISVAGTMYSVSELSSIGDTYTLISGAAGTNGTGQSNLTIEGSIGITVSDGVVNFGSGHVSMNSSNGQAVLYTTNQSWNDWTNTSLQTDVRSGLVLGAANTGFKVDNSGTVPLNLTILASKYAEEWLCPGNECLGEHTKIQAEFGCDERDTHNKQGNDDQNCCHGALGNFNGGHQVLANNSGASSTVRICDYWFPQDNKDEIIVDLFPTIPDDAAAGLHTISFTFTAQNVQ